MYNIVCLATASTEVEEFVQNPGVVKTYLDKYTPAVIGFLVQIIVAIIVLLVGIKIIKSVVKVIKKGFDRSHIDDGVGTFLTSLIKYALYFILVMAILSSFGIATGSVVAVLGSAGLTIGMALQGSLSNFAGGVLILLLKPFVLGDYIIDNTTGEEGTVSNISIFYTRLKTIDNKVVLIPNGKLSDSCITNVSMMEKRRIDIYVTVSYSADLQKTKNVLNNVAISQVLRLEGEPIDIFVSELKDSAVEMGIRVWAKNEDYWTLKWKMTEDIKNALDANHIEIPFPQLDVNLKK
ncbi:MAG: mechanosensitive ion channel family protein [Agathobacter sp.]|uniref:mechanosensitive ion channel family protein n=1 Tax=Agathobacter sp. TaxID=2021311 RepID=UPI003992ADFC